MPDSEQKKRSTRTIIPIPKPDEKASDDVLRDESTQYGDDAEIRLPRRKRTLMLSPRPLPARKRIKSLPPLMLKQPPSATQLSSFGIAPFPGLIPSFL